LETDNGSPLGVCVLPAPPRNAPRPVRHEAYIHELLGHSGICYEAVAYEELPARLDRLRLLVTVGETPFPAELQTAVTAWVGAGGAWLSIGGVCGMGELLGASYTAPSFVLWGVALRVLGEGFLDARGSSHAVLADLPLPLHFFNGISVEPRGADVLAWCLDAHHRRAEAPGVLERASGRGRCMLVAPDLTGTVVHVQQGIPVVRDGVPAPDGTGAVSDGVLKTDDGQVLDWLLDREEVPGAPGLRAFLRPVADQWRDLLLRAIFHLASTQGVPLPLLWYYPRGLPALGHLSHDTDGNDPELARALLETLDRAQARGTWCVIRPGYEPAVIADIREAGHELATHFDAMTPGCAWSEEAFDRQWRELCELFGEQPVTNKNHYLRWEGDTDFFEWCVRRGLRVDQSKGVSKTGEAGFNFGTCHPHRPVTGVGRLLPILELPTLTQDLLIFAPEALVQPLLEASLRHHGVLHLLFHPAHVKKPGVAEALVSAVRAGRAAGMEWWTAREISEWEEARRAAGWSRYHAIGSGCTVTLQASAALPGATVLWLALEATRVRVNGAEVHAEPVQRWGVRFLSATANLAGGEAAVFEVAQ